MLVTRTPDVPTIAAGRHRFRRAQPVDAAVLAGEWEVVVTGPKTVRGRWDRALKVLRVPGLRWLSFDGRGGGAALAATGRRGRGPSEPIQTVRVVDDISRIDGLPCVTVSFPGASGTLLPWVVIELRQLVREGTWPVDEGWLLGLAFLDAPGRIPVPVLLQRIPDEDAG